MVVSTPNGSTVGCGEMVGDTLGSWDAVGAGEGATDGTPVGAMDGVADG